MNIFENDVSQIYLKFISINYDFYEYISLIALKLVNSEYLDCLEKDQVIDNIRINWKYIN